MRTLTRSLIAPVVVGLLATATNIVHGQGNGQIPARTQINRNNPAPQGNVPQQANHARPPQGWEVTPQQQKWIDQILNAWEARSQTINTYSCKFELLEYNPAFIRDPNVHYKQAVGEIKYQKPNEAIYSVANVQVYQAPQAQGQKASYVANSNDPGEYWLCNGKAIYEYDQRNKHVIERKLPEHMRGEAIANGPLPFLFGAKAEKLKQRYWFKPLAPPKVRNPQTGKEEYVKGEYWLAAKPKTKQDAQNYDLVELIIDQKEFLPQAMQIYMPGSKERRVFRFNNREVNPRQRFWQGEFIEPNVPRGWKLVRDEGGGGANVNNRVGQRPRGGLQIPVAQQRR